MRYKNLHVCWICFSLLLLPASASAQDEIPAESAEKATEIPVPEQVDVRPEAEDAEIREQARRSRSPEEGEDLLKPEG